MRLLNSGAGQRAACLACVLISSLLSACSGGSPDSSSLAVALSPARESATFRQGTAYTFSESATVKGTVSGQVVILIIDSAGVLQPGVPIQQQSSDVYVATLTTNPSLSVGIHRGVLQIRLCSDNTCGKQYGETSLPYTFTVTASPPLPALSGLSPDSALAGQQNLTVTATGNNFTPSSTLLWNGSPRNTTYVSPSKLTAQITDADVASANVNHVSISVPDPDGGTSNVITFNVENSAPTLGEINPASATTGDSALVITATGTNFVPTSVLQWNGNPRMTSYISSTQLTAQLSASDLASAGNASITVFTPTPGGGSTQAVTFAIYNPAPKLSQINARSATVGCAGFSINVLGSNFLPISTVQWNGSPRSTTYISAHELKAQITANDVSAAGMANVTVTNGPPGGGTSKPASFNIDDSGPATTDAVAFQIDTAHSGSSSTVCPTVTPSAPAWQVTFDGPPSYALIADDKVFVTAQVSGGSGLYALNTETGQILWGPIVIPGSVNAAYDAGRVFVVSSAGQMQAFDAASGTPKWSATLPGQYVFDSAPSARNGFVYTGGSGSAGTLYALDENSGALIWSQGVANGDDSTPAVTANGVYVAYPCRTYDFNPMSGVPVWTHSSGCDGGGGATPVVANGRLYAPDGFGTYDGDIFDAETGMSLNSYAGDFPPAFNSTDGYFLQGGTLRDISLKAESAIWSFAGDGQLTTSPILVNQTVYIGSSSGELYAIDAISGQELWSTDIGTAIPRGAAWAAGIQLSGLSAGEGLLVVPAGNTLTAYKITNGQQP